jgi:hypothetical protein
MVKAPTFSAGAGALNLKAFVLLSMLSTSYIAHYNAPSFYKELKNTSMPRFNTVVGLAFAASIVTFCFMMSTGNISVSMSVRDMMMHYISRSFMSF